VCVCVSPRICVCMRAAGSVPDNCGLCVPVTQMSQAGQSCIDCDGVSRLFGRKVDFKCISPPFNRYGGGEGYRLYGYEYGLSFITTPKSLSISVSSFSFSFSVVEKVRRGCRQYARCPGLCVSLRHVILYLFWTHSVGKSEGERKREIPMMFLLKQNWVCRAKLIPNSLSLSLFPSLSLSPSL
jgi:hypothetical protein